MSEVTHAQDEIPPPPMNMQPAAAWSVFNESFRNQMYEFALPYGRWLIQYRPKTMEGFEAQYRGDRNFQRMISIYGHMADEAADPLVREAYVDSALTLYDRVLTIFDEEEIDHFRWRFDRARFVQINQNRIEDGRMMALNEYMELYDNDPKRLTELADGYYVLYLVREMLTNEMRDEAIELMLHAEQFDDGTLKAQFDEIRGSIFRSPEERIQFINSQLESNPDDLELKSELFELHQRAGNRQKVRELAIELYEMDPSFDNIMRMADYASANAQYSESNRYLKQALEQTDDNKVKAELNLEISDNYLNMRNLRTAREYARRAQRQNPNWGNPLIKHAEIYAQAVTECSTQLDRLDKVVYWLVIDYLERARQVDSSVASTVQRQIPNYRGVTPNPDEKFYAGWENGDTIRIDGSLKDCYAWINETTTVR